ncbi:MAG TPA: DUF1003 domain-containing protein [Candidatus Xenobia bacterium]|jgi:uncharacterized membrane protein
MQEHTTAFTIPNDENNPKLADVMEQNIRTMLRLRHEASTRRSFQYKISDAITDFSGQLGFVYLHVLWFGAWIVLNMGWMGLTAFDPFPYGLLTMVVSLEAIFLSTFVLISQNRLSEAAERRADLDLQIGLLTEHEVTRVLQMLEAIHAHLQIENHEDSDLAQLEMETRPEDVLEEIAAVERRVKGNHRNLLHRLVKRAPKQGTSNAASE